MAWFYGLIAVVVVLAICAAIAYVMADSVVSGLVRNEKKREGYTELSPLFRQIEEQKSRLKSTTTDLQGMDISFRLIAESMQEGMIFLDTKGIILMMNGSASAALGLEGERLLGKHIFAASHDAQFQAAVHSALGGNGGEELLSIDGSAVELAASPVLVDGVIRGVVLLLFDVTDRVAAEQMRREFSANVSHELKTPLTSISGYAELMKDGLVKPEDTQRFAESIYKEAQRLIALIEDIIRLSRLDENSDEIAKNNVELLPVITGVAERLSGKAEQYAVTLNVTGEEASVFGERQLLDEMIYNLCDNAIKYNRPGGKVDVRLENTPKGAVLSVSDDGIGIPKEHQSRIFERFYRVDKSHSKETGGTGLGLSIVKHGAAFHSAELTLVSAPDKGTTVTLAFPPTGNNIERT
jgi:two-component system phosphate regulon sensor histidine kinase PhoR